MRSATLVITPLPRLARFENPILPGEAAVEDAIVDVARHLLRPDQHAIDFVVIDRGKYERELT